MCLIKLVILLIDCMWRTYSLTEKETFLMAVMRGASTLMSVTVQGLPSKLTTVIMQCCCLTVQSYQCSGLLVVVYSNVHECIGIAYPQQACYHTYSYIVV
jgi:hypothetical protein